MQGKKVKPYIQKKQHAWSVVQQLEEAINCPLRVTVTVRQFDRLSPYSTDNVVCNSVITHTSREARRFDFSRKRAKDRSMAPYATRECKPRRT